MKTQRHPSEIRDSAVGPHAYRPGSLTAVAAAVAVLLGSSAVMAEPMLQYGTLYRNADMSRWTDNYVELGALYSTRDSYKFGEWSGLRNNGVSGDVGFNWLSRARGDDASYWSIHGAGLGLQTRKFSTEVGRQGSWSVNFSADRLVRSEIDDARFIHQGLGSNNLTLTPECRPPFTGTNTGANPISSHPQCLHGYKIEQGRDFYRLGMNAALSEGWDMSVAYREDVRDGTRVTGIYNSFVNTGSSFGSPGFTNAPLNVPYEINDKTQQLETLLSYADKKAQLQLGYTYSRYDNELNSFSVANPLHTDQIGRMSLAPSNEFHQLQATGAYSLTRDTRFVSKLSYGLGYQNDAFLPYTTRLATTEALPRSSLDGEVRKTLVDLALTSRLGDKSSVKLGYQYYDYDNRTPIAHYLYAGRDGNQPPLPGGANRRTNAPISSTDSKGTLDADYLIGDQTVLRGQLEYKQTKYKLADRADTDTAKAGVELRKPVMDSIMGSVGYTYTQKTGAEYNKNVFFRNSYTDPVFQTSVNGGNLTNHPSMRAFMYADYDENRFRTSANWTLSETLSLQSSLDGYRQRFKGPDCAKVVDTLANNALPDLPDTCLGRTLAEGGNANLDLQWQPEENLSFFSFLNLGETVVEQAGRTWAGPLNAATAPTAADTRRNWFGRTTNQDHSVGLGGKWQPKEIWDLGGQYVFSHSVSKTAVMQGAAPAVVSGTTASGSLAQSTPLPDAETTINSVQLYAKWNYSRKMTVRFNYLYERLKSSNWAYDGLGPTSVSGVLLTGQQSPRYENHVIGVSLAMHSW